ncbi:MAG: DUF4160 domain-containing protein [Candidatus Hydrogenedentota bacterium]
MPELCRFYGIVIRMYHNDHNPPHIHAVYGEHVAQIGILSLSRFGGYLPPRALGLVVEWATQHQEELMDNWERARSHQSLQRIAPLP